MHVPLRLADNRRAFRVAIMSAHAKAKGEAAAEYVAANHAIRANRVIRFVRHAEIVVKGPLHLTRPVALV